MAEYQKVGRVTTESVRKGSGRHWAEWVRLLDRAGARAWSHAEIVAHLKTKYKLTAWWQQGVAYGYQIATGRREDGQNLKGHYSVTVTGTLPIAAPKLWKKMMTPAGLAAWLKPLAPLEIKAGRAFECEGEIFGSIRTLKAPERLRLRWTETDSDKPTVVNLLLVTRPGEKCILAFTHEQLKTARQREDMRAFWKARLGDLRAWLQD